MIIDLTFIAHFIRALRTKVRRSTARKYIQMAAMRNGGHICLAEIEHARRYVNMEIDEL